ncbi:hypothetical protein [Streptomyces sp. SD31]
MAPGRTTVKLPYCPYGQAAVPVTTAAETATPDDTDNPTYYLCTITVR